MGFRLRALSLPFILLLAAPNVTSAATTVTCTIDHNNDNTVNILDVLYTLYCAVGVGPCVGEVLTCPEGVSCGDDTLLTNNQCVVNCNSGGTCYDAAYAAGDTAGQATGFAAGQADITPGSGAYQAGYADGLAAGVACSLGDLPGTVTGSETVGANSTESYSIAEMQGATNYTWSVPNGASIDDGQGGPNATITFADEGGEVCVFAGNDCDTTNPVCLTVEIGASACDATGAVAYYPFEAADFSGGALANKSTSGDSLGSTADGTNCDDGFISTNAKIGSGSFNFDGDQDSVTLSSAGNNKMIPAAGDFSIAGWIFINTTDQPHHYQIIRLQNSPGQSGMEFLVADGWGEGKLALSWPGGYTGDPPMGNTKVPVQQWVHVAMTRDGGDITFYLNGAEDGGGTMTGGSPSADTPHIGGRKCDDGDESFDGLMDELSVWNRALTQTDIDCLYNGGDGKELQPCCESAPGICDLSVIAPECTECNTANGYVSDGQGGCIYAPTPTFTDDFSSDNWDDNNGTIGVDTTDQRLEYTIYRHSTNDGASYDFGAPVSDSAWVLRFKLVTQNINGGGSSHKMSWVGLSSVDKSSAWGSSKDGIGFNHQISSSSSERDIHITYSDGQEYGSNQQSEFSTSLTNSQLHYYELARLSATSMKLSLYSDAEYTNKVESQTVTIPASLTGLRYFVVTNDTTYNIGGDFSGYIDNLEFYDGIGTLEEPSPWNLSGAKEGSSYDFSSKETQPRGFAMSNDGLNMYTVGDNNHRVNQWTLSTPFDVTTASYKTYYAEVENHPRGIAFKPDGSKMFTISYTAGSIREYNLSTPWDLDSAVYAQQKTGYGGNTSSVGLHFSPDGTRMYHGCQTCDASSSIREYSLSTPWDVSTLSFTTWVNIDDGDPTSIVVSDDGKTLWGGGYGSKKVHEFTMSTAWDLSTASATGTTLDLTNGNPFGMSAPTGQKLFVAYDGGKVYEYTGVGL